MIIVGYNPRPLPLDRFTSKKTASSVFKPDMLDALHRACERHPEWSPSTSIQLFGATAEDFAAE
jgi:hypothetical protein